MTRQSGLSGYGLLEGLPELVARAVRTSRTLGYDKACTPEVGRLLRLLVASRTGIRVGETGTACGVGAAWIASALDRTSTLVTVELDPQRSAAAAHVFEHTPSVTLLSGDWSSIAQHAPFDLLFVDGGPAKFESDLLLSIVAPRGLLLFDDLTPPGAWSAEQRALYQNGDPVRAAWLTRSDCLAQELQLTPTSSVLIVARLA